MLGVAIPANCSTIKGTPRSTIFPQTYNALLNQHADVLVSHEAPACHPRGFEAIDTLIEAMGVKRAFHGHHHESTAYPNTGPCRIVGLGACVVATIDGDFLHSAGSGQDEVGSAGV